ncbi:MAG TPA: ABC transporter permease subunit [Nitrososphaerales archaeon]|nr:ABC transporter permease subunit [Nitrososphaerales archaeon]
MLVLPTLLLVIVATYVVGVYYVGQSAIASVPLFSIISIGRVTAVYFISLAVGLAFGILAATSETAEHILVPLFDIGQSVPILGYFPVVLTFLIVIFPGGVGNQVGALFLLFTAMEWDIFFGVVGAVKAIPASVEEAAKGYGFSGTNYLRYVVLPAVLPALLSSSILAWNDGWTFDAAAEFVTFANSAGQQIQYTVTGLGYFITSAANSGNLAASWFGVLVMGEVIFFSNQLIWHTLQTRVAKHKPVLANVIREDFQSPLGLRRRFRRLFGFRLRQAQQSVRLSLQISTKALALFFVVTLAIIGVVIYANLPIGAAKGLASALTAKGGQVYNVPLYSLFTVGRLLIAYSTCVAISLVCAVLAVTKKNFNRYFYPIYDLGRSVPYLAVFLPMFVTFQGLMPVAIAQEMASLILLFLAMVWYLLFNVVTAARNLPNELLEVSTIFGVTGRKRVTDIILPAVLPAFITGSLLAWGGGWNVVIYSEYVQLQGHAAPYVLPGLGYLLDNAASVLGDIPLVIFFLFIMSGIVILLERVVWRRLLRRVERFGVEFN